MNLIVAEDIVREPVKAEEGVGVIDGWGNSVC